MESSSCPQQLPTWNLGKDSKQTENCRPNYQQCPMWNPGTELRAGFFTWGIVIWKLRGWAVGRSIRQLSWALGRIIYKLKLTCPVEESQLGWELECKKSRANQRGTRQPPSETVRKVVNSKWFTGYHAWMFWKPSEVHFGSHYCHQSVKKQNLTK